MTKRVGLAMLLLAGVATAAEPAPKPAPKPAASTPASPSKALKPPPGLPKAPKLTPEQLEMVTAAQRGEAPPIPPPFRWDIPGAIEQIEIPGEQVALGIPMRLHAVRTTWKVEDLYAHFMESFIRAKLYVASHEEINLPLRDANLTGLDPFRKRSYTVILQQNPDRTVTCILGEADLGRRQNAGAPFAPMHASGKEPFVATVEGLRSLSYVATAQPNEILQFYRQELPKQGFTEIEPQKFRKGNTLWWIQTEREGNTTRVMVVDSGALPSTQ